MVKKEKEICAGFVAVPQSVARCSVKMENALDYRLSAICGFRRPLEAWNSVCVDGGSGTWFPGILASSSSVEILIRKIV